MFEQLGQIRGCQPWPPSPSPGFPGSGTFLAGVWLAQSANGALCLEGVPDLPVAPQDEAGLTKTFQTWPRGEPFTTEPPGKPEHFLM